MTAACPERRRSAIVSRYGRSSSGICGVEGLVIASVHDERRRIDERPGSFGKPVEASSIATGRRPPVGRRASLSFGNACPAVCCACSRVPPLDKYAVIPRRPERVTTRRLRKARRRGSSLDHGQHLPPRQRPPGQPLSWSPPRSGRGLGWRRPRVVAPLVQRWRSRRRDSGPPAWLAGIGASEHQVLRPAAIWGAARESTTRPRGRGPHRGRQHVDDVVVQARVRGPEGVAVVAVPRLLLADLQPAPRIRPPTAASPATAPPDRLAATARPEADSRAAPVGPAAALATLLRDQPLSTRKTSFALERGRLTGRPSAPAPGCSARPRSARRTPPAGRARTATPPTASA